MAALLCLVGMGYGTALSAQQPARSAAVEPATLGRVQIDALLARPAEVLVLDVRRADEISAKGGFPVYLSIQIADLERSLPLIPRDRTIVTVSNHAARAKRAAGVLTAAGFRVAGAAGVEDYAAQGGTLVGQAPAAAGASATAADRP